jgi:predicted nucleic acid-binding protein
MLPPFADDFTVVLDTNVLVPPFLRDVLLNLTEAGVYTPKISEDILRELDMTLRLPKFNLEEWRVRRIVDLIRQSFSDCIVHGYNSIQVAFELPDPEDLHVIQAAIKSRAQQIITYNLDDFPNEHLESLDLEAVHPDILLESVFDLYPGPCNRVILNWLGRNSRPPQNMHEFRFALINHRLTKATAKTSEWRER